jgi:hypothetical protein
MENLSIPLVIQTSSVVLFVVIIYIISFIVDVLALKKSVTRQIAPDMGMQYNNGMALQPGFM